MRQADVKIGSTYEVLVSGKRTVVRVNTRRLRAMLRRGRYPLDLQSVDVVVFDCTNLRTGRTLTMRASRLRREVQSDMARHFDEITGRTTTEEN